MVRRFIQSGNLFTAELDFCETRLRARAGIDDVFFIIYRDLSETSEQESRLD